MDNIDQDLKEICLELHSVDALKFGDFKMKVGINSPVYFDLRVMVSHPTLMDKLGKVIYNYFKHLNIKSSVLCGVPYTALPLSTLVAIKSNLPMLIRRKEPKKYGTMKLIEGKYEKGENCLIIEDVVTSGGSILETATDLKNDGLIVTDAIVIVDREQGGNINLIKSGIKMHSLLTLSKALNILFENGRLDQTVVDKVNKYIAENQIFPDGRPMSPQPAKNRLNMTYTERSSMTKCDGSKKLFLLMEKKQTNLCAALDVTKSKDLLELADQIGPFVCIIKTHYDIVVDWTSETELALKQLSDKHHFILMEDRKFGDIGNTVKLQCDKVLNWAEFITMHSIGGPGSLQAAAESTNAVCNGKRKPGIFLVAELSAKDNLISSQYTKSTVELGEMHGNVVVGFVCQNPSTFNDPGFIQLTPGVSTKAGNDSLGQVYVTPEDSVIIKGGDVVVVGRAISQSADPKATARDLQETLWNAYKKRTAQ